ncbi:MAG: hypothetical protein HC859_09260 [Bacteroidia bacterium]|nr:hypothetical protein [Bacteroidia bacterium]
MNRKEFIRTSAIVGGASILPANSIFAHSLQQSGMDKLTDKDGKFALQPLPYNENFLEPEMGEETVHLHYTFHHGDAVKAANKDLEMVHKAMDENNLDTVRRYPAAGNRRMGAFLLFEIPQPAWRICG